MTDFQTDPVQVHVPNGTAIWGESDNWVGVFGQADGNTPGCAGVYGNGLAGTTAVAGVSETGYGVFGATNGAGAGVWGKGGDDGGPGVIGSSVRWHGVYGETSAAGSTGAAAVWGENKADGSGVVGHSLNGAGIYGKSEHGNAAYFEGDVLVTGDVKLLNGDVAELFAADPSTIAEPGTLMSLDQTGQVAPSSTAYDRKVIGVVAEQPVPAGDDSRLRPGQRCPPNRDDRQGLLPGGCRLWTHRGRRPAHHLSHSWPRHEGQRL